MVHVRETGSIKGATPFLKHAVNQNLLKGPILKIDEVLFTRFSQADTAYDDDKYYEVRD